MGSRRERSPVPSPRRVRFKDNDSEVWTKPTVPQISGDLGRVERELYLLGDDLPALSLIASTSIYEYLEYESEFEKLIEKAWDYDFDSIILAMAKKSFFTENKLNESLERAYMLDRSCLFGKIYFDSANIDFIADFKKYPPEDRVLILTYLSLKNELSDAFADDLQEYVNSNDDLSPNFALLQGVADSIV